MTPLRSSLSPCPLQSVKREVEKAQEVKRPKSALKILLGRVKDVYCAPGQECGGGGIEQRKGFQRGRSGARSRARVLLKFRSFRFGLFTWGEDELG